MDTTIAIISIYFGKIPEYFPLWIESCKRNPTIDFFFVTDQNVTNDAPNITVISSDLQDFKLLAEQKLGFEILLKTPYKLCDFKPAYGLIFQDILAGYDYWGHCDIDLIWGDIRGFVERYQISRYDKFLPLGHLSLYRNTEENNRRFMESLEGLSDYKKVFQSEQNYLFDEFAVPQIYRNKYTFFESIIFADIQHWKRRYALYTNMKSYPSIYEEFSARCCPINFSHQIFMWVDGKVYQFYWVNGKIESREYIYIHLQKRKWKLCGSLSKDMVISQNGVFPVVLEETDMMQLIKQYNPYSLFADTVDDLCEFVRHCWSYFKRKVIRTERDKIVVDKKARRRFF